MTNKSAGLRDVALLMARLILGVSFIIHGWPKIHGGPSFWHGLGGTVLGTSNTPLATPLGAVGAFIEFGGGIMLICGFGFRTVCFLLFLQMLAALSVHLRGAPPMNTFAMYSHALEDAGAFLALLAAGPGRLSACGGCCKAKSPGEANSP